MHIIWYLDLGTSVFIPVLFVNAQVLGAVGHGKCARIGPRAGKDCPGLHREQFHDIRRNFERGVTCVTTSRPCKLWYISLNTQNVIRS